MTDKAPRVTPQHTPDPACEWNATGGEGPCPKCHPPVARLKAQQEQLRGALARIVHEAVDTPHCRDIARAALASTEAKP